MLHLGREWSEINPVGRAVIAACAHLSYGTKNDGISVWVQTNGVSLTQQATRPFCLAYDQCSRLQVEFTLLIDTKESHA